MAVESFSPEWPNIISLGFYALTIGVVVIFVILLLIVAFLYVTKKSLFKNNYEIEQDEENDI